VKGVKVYQVNRPHARSAKLGTLHTLHPSVVSAGEVPYRGDTPLPPRLADLAAIRTSAARAVAASALAADDGEAR
jgi:hypothetical protein